MLDSITWGTWDQLQWRGENDAAAWGQGDAAALATPGSIKKMRSAQAAGANSSEWRKPRPRVSDVPLFERLLSKLAAEVPTSVPDYRVAPLRAVKPPPHATLRAAWAEASLAMPGAFAVDWRALSEAVAPAAGGLDALRAERKEQQVRPATCLKIMKHIHSACHVPVLLLPQPVLRTEVKK
jgi:hypothetical protein